MKRKYKKILKFVYIVAFVVAGFAASELFKGSFKPIKPNPVDLSAVGDTVSVISAGQADSALISSGGKYCLIDAGQTDTGDTNVVQYLRSAGVKEIELFVITHFHTDHTSEVMDVLDNFKVKTIVIPNLSKQNVPTTQFFTAFLDRVERDDISLKPAQKGDVYTVGNGTVTILDDTYNDLSVNDTSVATLFVQDDFSYLSTGDGEAEYEARLLKVFSDGVTLFAAGHHGSSTSNTEKFISAIKPKFVAVSAGRENEYGHPHNEVTKRFKDKKIQYNVTFSDGTLVYSIKDKKLIAY